MVLIAVVNTIKDVPRVVKHSLVNSHPIVLSSLIWSRFSRTNTEHNGICELKLDQMIFNDDEDITLNINIGRFIEGIYYY